jgi:hypothetical protein
MRDVVRDLVEIAAKDPLPDDHTSSHWKHFGAETSVTEDGEGLRLQGIGFGQMTTGRRGRVAGLIGRWSFRRVTQALDSFPRVYGLAKNLADDLSADLTFDVWRQAVSLALLQDHWAAHQLHPTTFALIGEGYGFLGALIRRAIPEARIYYIDLPKILVFQADTHRKADPEAKMTLLQNGVDEICFVLPHQIEQISDTIDCAINIASMGEMTETSIASYFEFLRRRSGPGSRFYCANRASKELPGGEVTEFSSYPWLAEDRVYLEGDCPYLSHYWSPETLTDGPRIGGLRVPFLNYFDGEFVQRLVHLSPVE